jgi:hypothetical protein
VKFPVSRRDDFAGGGGACAVLRFFHEHFAHHRRRPENRAKSPSPPPPPSPARKVFRCNLPPGPLNDDATAKETTLEFRCRGPSCGALEAEEDAAVLDEEDSSVVDPNFFDRGYSMAGSTGFKVGPTPAGAVCGWGCCVFRFFAAPPASGSRDGAWAVSRYKCSSGERIRFSRHDANEKNLKRSGRFSFVRRPNRPTRPTAPRPRSGRDRDSRSRRWRGRATPTARGCARYSAGWDRPRTSSSSGLGLGSSGPIWRLAGPASS